MFTYQVSEDVCPFITVIDRITHHIMITGVRFKFKVFHKIFMQVFHFLLNLGKICRRQNKTLDNSQARESFLTDSESLKLKGFISCSKKKMGKENNGFIPFFLCFLASWTLAEGVHLQNTTSYNSNSTFQVNTFFMLFASQQCQPW